MKRIKSASVLIDGLNYKKTLLLLPDNSPEQEQKLRDIVIYNIRHFNSSKIYGWIEFHDGSIINAEKLYEHEQNERFGGEI
jgi:hypothetical protein